jgi:hypothetical protein
LPYYVVIKNYNLMKKERSHARSEGKTQTSISLRKEVLDAAKEAAAKDNRSLSNWLELLLKERLQSESSKSGSTEEGGV